VTPPFLSAGPTSARECLAWTLAQHDVGTLRLFAATDDAMGDPWELHLLASSEAILATPFIDEEPALWLLDRVRVHASHSGARTLHIEGPERPRDGRPWTPDGEVVERLVDPVGSVAEPMSELTFESISTLDPRFRDLVCRSFAASPDPLTVLDGPRIAAEAMLMEAAGRAGRRSWVVTRAGAPAGLVSVLETQPGLGEIDILGVLPGARDRRSVVDGLARHGLRSLVAIGCRGVGAWSLASNEPSRRLQERFGMTEVGRRKRWRLELAPVEAPPKRSARR
jgi:ribosomal protein S18 acetylase RimI-like enzyme